MKLAIISHTEHYKTESGVIVGWSSTVNEINNLLTVFDEIYHVAMLHPNKPPESCLAYKSDKIIFVPMQPLGGRNINSKLKTLIHAPKVIKIVQNTLAKVDYFQLRTPTGIAVYLIPYLTFFSKKKGWYKYAGNWNQKKAPFGYALQRYFLKKQNRKVTINGTWKNQQKKLITFENPCLTLNDIEQGKCFIGKKQIETKLEFCFVGRLERAKGVMHILEAIKRLPDNEKKRIKMFHFVGDGPEMEFFKTFAKTLAVPFTFHGYLSRENVISIYKSCQVFVLPSASEGFPKVIAEAMNFGCIPIASNVSSISQYVIPNKTGFLIHPITAENLVLQMQKVFRLNNESYFEILKNQREIVKRFTFTHYNNRILNEIIEK